jgi:hypothetical protein
MQGTSILRLVILVLVKAFVLGLSIFPWNSSLDLVAEI